MECKHCAHNRANGECAAPQAQRRHIAGPGRIQLPAVQMREPGAACGPVAVLHITTQQLELTHVPAVVRNGELLC